MNAAARLVHKNVLAPQLTRTMVFSLRKIVYAAISLTLLLSAIGIIYSTHHTRLLHANYERNAYLVNQLNIEYGQLLLEKSTLNMPARIQKEAEKNLDMMMPSDKTIQVLSTAP